jgi:NAD(P)H-flavin reductase
MHEKLRVPETDNPTSTGLTPMAVYQLQTDPLLAIGTLDSQKRPWTTVWGGKAGFARSLGAGIVGIRTTVDRKYDPVVQALMGGKDDGEVVREEGKGRLIGGLAIDLMRRMRMKLCGTLIAGALAKADILDEEGIDISEEGGENGDQDVGEGEIQLVQKIEQSLGNCPKYLNKKHISPARPRPKLVSQEAKLPVEAIKLINKADLFFISSSREEYDMDTNHRGGPAGFVRVISNDSDGAEIVYPEYSGNRLYQSLGNLMVTPLAGLAFPDFDSGDILYITGHTEILIGKDAATLLPRSNLAVKIKVIEAIFVKEGLPFRGTADEPSPYNPNVRLLPSEGNIAAQIKDEQNTARLVGKTKLTPTINRYRFAMINPSPYKAGQWVAMDFSKELDIGYSHMRNDDPRSLNDDYVRTFTVSSPPADTDAKPHDEFEITVRRIGPVTDFLSRQNAKSGLEVSLKGFGGDFVIQPSSAGAAVAFVAGGVGITPLLAQLPSLDLTRLRLIWILRIDDWRLVEDVFSRYRELARNTVIHFTGVSKQGLAAQQKEEVEQFKNSGAVIELRRPEEKDLIAIDVDRWYLCAGRPLRDKLLGWLKGRTVVFENFDY